MMFKVIGYEGAINPPYKLIYDDYPYSKYHIK